MTLATARQDRANLNEFEFLAQQRVELVASTSAWMNRLIALNASVATGDRGEVIALRDALIAELRAVLGV